MKDWLARKRQELTRKHPDLSEYKPGDLAYVTTGGTYKGRIVQIAPYSPQGTVETLDPFSLKPVTRFMSANCISPALEHEIAEIEERLAGDMYYMMNEVVLRHDDDEKPPTDFSPVYKVISVSNITGGLKLQNIATEETLTGEDGKPQIITRALDLRPPTTDESRHARAQINPSGLVEITGPNNAPAPAEVMGETAMDAALSKPAANKNKPPFELRETLTGLADGHSMLAKQIGRLKLRSPFRQALAAEKEGRDLAANQRSAVDLIHSMEAALQKARDAHKVLKDNERTLTAHVQSHDLDSI